MYVTMARNGSLESTTCEEGNPLRTRVTWTSTDSVNTHFFCTILFQVHANAPSESVETKISMLSTDETGSKV